MFAFTVLMSLDAQVLAAVAKSRTPKTHQRGVKIGLRAAVLKPTGVMKKLNKMLEKC